MREQEFSKKAKEIVLKHLTQKNECEEEQTIKKYSDLKSEDIYIVWQCFILNNNKALLATPIEDDKYFEVTYDRVKNKIYLDEYVRKFNKEIDIR